MEELRGRKSLSSMSHFWETRGSLNTPNAARHPEPPFQDLLTFPDLFLKKLNVLPSWYPFLFFFLDELV